MTLEARTADLLALVEADRQARCDAIARETGRRNGALLAQAHADARLRMREAFAEERQRAASEIAAAEADLATRRRRHAQQRASALLALGLARLPDALARHWHDDALRGAWIDAVVAGALAALPRDAWRIAHPPGWDRGEQQALSARLEPVLASAPSFVGDPGIAAGLRIAAAGNVIDGSLAGILSDRGALGSRLLGLLEAGA